MKNAAGLKKVVMVLEKSPSSREKSSSEEAGDELRRVNESEYAAIEFEKDVCLLFV